MTKSETFAALHQPGNPLILFNVWDAGSAQAVAKAGAAAIATGSASVGGALGFGDGQEVPLDLVIENAARIVGAIDLPVTLDLEAGYGESVADVRASTARVAETGVVGINLEDQIIGGSGLVAIRDQAERIAAAAGNGLWVNARTDLFLQSGVGGDHAALIDAALERAHAFAEAGARSFFVPLLADPALLARLCEASPLPVNVMMFGGCPSHAELAKLGVARISHGPGPWRGAMAWLEAAAREAMASA